MHLGELYLRRLRFNHKNQHAGVFRVVGWTKTGKSVILQPVPWLQYPFGSPKHEELLDLEWLTQNHIDAPVHTRHKDGYRPTLHPRIAEEVKRIMTSADVAALVCSYFAPPEPFSNGFFLEPVRPLLDSFGRKNFPYSRFVPPEDLL